MAGAMMASTGAAQMPRLASRVENDAARDKDKDKNQDQGQGQGRSEQTYHLEAPKTRRSITECYGGKRRGTSAGLDVELLSRCPLNRS
ncbi:hypothetical protein CSOJ01_03401 [Colletotrichum sojae]|uniref:Uncharacterized protein n=1 Tax=Colletotrichum sojae TaxID=2175907 RepID=A0A8H6JN22_9PEZI|nr:hypothetical protein CSOJ01_03401 [Colletotrichum sojae]